MGDWVGKHQRNTGKQGEYNFPLAIAGNSGEHRGTVKFANILENIVISPRGKDPPPQKCEKLFFVAQLLKKSQPVEAFSTGDGLLFYIHMKMVIILFTTTRAAKGKRS